jgi:hypothetical protein
MKFRKTQRRVETPAVTKPKRTGLNLQQIALLQQVRDLPAEDILRAEEAIHEARVGRQLGLTVVGRTTFYDPRHIAEFLGWSIQTVTRYLYAYLRVIRRDDETAREFRQRRSAADPDAAPLLSTISKGADLGTHPKTYRLVSTRILVWLVMAPTYLKGDDPDGKRDVLRQLREDLSAGGLKSGKAKKIGANASVTSWEIEPSKEVML